MLGLGSTILLNRVYSILFSVFAVEPVVISPSTTQPVSTSVDVVSTEKYSSPGSQSMVSSGHHSSREIPSSLTTTSVGFNTSSQSLPSAIFPTSSESPDTMGCPAQSPSLESCQEYINRGDINIPQPPQNHSGIVSSTQFVVPTMKESPTASNPIVPPCQAANCDACHGIVAGLVIVIVILVLVVIIVGIICFVLWHKQRSNKELTSPGPVDQRNTVHSSANIEGPDSSPLLTGFAHLNDLVDNTLEENSLFAVNTSAAITPVSETHSNRWFTASIKFGSSSSPRSRQTYPSPKEDTHGNNNSTQMVT
jgi:hypothetical protein